MHCETVLKNWNYRFVEVPSLKRKKNTYAVQQTETENSLWIMALMAGIQAEPSQQLAGTVYSTSLCHISVIPKPCVSVFGPLYSKNCCCFLMHLNRFSCGSLDGCQSVRVFWFWMADRVKQGWLGIEFFFSSISRLLVPLAETLPLCHSLLKCRMCVCVLMQSGLWFQGQTGRLVLPPLVGSVEEVKVGLYDLSVNHPSI